MKLNGTWKETLFEMDMQPLESMNEVAEQEYSTKSQDIGLIHPKNGAGILVRDNKKVEGFANFGLGFRMDPDTQSFSIYAPNIKLFTSNFKTYDYEENQSYFQKEFQDILNVMGEKGDVNGLS